MKGLAPVTALFVFLILAPPTFALVKIHSLLPNPENESDEWIMLINTGDSPVSLAGMQLDDEPDAGSKPFTIGAEELPAHSTRRFPKSETGLILNNSKQKDQPFADMVRLISPTGEELDRVIYLSARTGEVISPTPVPSPTSPALPTLPPPTVTPRPTLSPTPRPSPSVSPSPTSLPSPTPAAAPVLGATVAAPPTNFPPTANSHPRPTRPAGWDPAPLGSIFLGLVMITIALTKSVLRLRRKFVRSQ